MRPSAFTVASRAASISASFVTSHGDGRDPAAIALSSPAVSFGQRAVAVPDRDRGARVQQPLDDGPADALRAAGDDGIAPAQIDRVGHACETNGAWPDWRAPN